ncbi:MAG: TetR/AcrR family transcriptional regulator C-terminal domain-containing protein [Deltaproteobacteria bacterium]|nr:TetR/AcrR family transcriptional regulator C-terminal domain-containing protein [Deltaproteobacteria bacterium]
MSREVILEAALAISDDEGIDGITIRKIASRLGSSPMGVYRHFDNKAAILSELVDRVIQIYDVTNHDVDPEDWQGWATQTCVGMRAALVAHSGIIPLLGSSGVTGMHIADVLEAFLGVLRGAGFEEEAVPLYLTLISYTIGSAAIESSVADYMKSIRESDMGEVMLQIQARYEAVPLERYPNVISSAGQLINFTNPDQFTFGLNTILSTASHRLESEG